MDKITAGKKRSIIEYLGNKYKRASKKRKSELIKEVCRELSIGSRQARRLLSGKKVNGRPKNPQGRGRPGKYTDPEFKQGLRLVWKSTKFMCSRHLKSAIPNWLKSVEARHGAFSSSVHERLLSISAPTIDRILKPHKALKGKSTTRSGGFRDEIPIQENIWNIDEPGFLEVDTAAHCGGSLLGEYISSFMTVDIASTWTETRAVWGKGSNSIVQAIEDIESDLPFEIKGYDSDNGTEVLNQHVLRYFRDERIARNKSPVQVTRARPYKKNDNAHVEQRNWSVARRWLGYERLDCKDMLGLVNHYYKDIVCPLMNHFFPSFKLADKIRVKSRTRRIYKDPLTPYARIINSPFVPEDQKSALKHIHDQLDPLILLDREQFVRRQIDNAIKAYRKGLPVTKLIPFKFQKISQKQKLLSYQNKRSGTYS